MKTLQKLTAVVMAAVMAVTMLTACSGGGGGGGGNSGGTPVAPTKYTATKAYQIEQKAKGKLVYQEFMRENSSSQTKTMSAAQGGTNIDPSKFVYKEWTKGEQYCADIYIDSSATKVWETGLIVNSERYVVIYASGQDETYSSLVELAKAGKPEIQINANQPIYLDLDRFVLMSGIWPDDPLENGISQMSALNDTNTTASTGVYKGYDAEILTANNGRKKATITFAYDKNNDLKALVYSDDEKKSVRNLSEFAIAPSGFNEARFGLSYYHAVDVTDAALAGLSSEK